MLRLTGLLAAFCLCSAPLLPQIPGAIQTIAGNVYFNDDVNFRARRIDTNGVMTTVAGSGAMGFSGDGGPATSAALNGNFGIALDNQGNLLIADSVNNRIRDVYGLASAVSATTSAAREEEH